MLACTAYLDHVWQVCSKACDEREQSLAGETSSTPWRLPLTPSLRFLWNVLQLFILASRSSALG